MKERSETTRGLSASILVLLLATVPACALAGAWTQPPGHLYARLSFAGINACHRFDSGGALIGLEGPGMPARGTEYRGREMRGYAEYGVTAGLTAYGSLTLKWIRTVEPLFIERFRVVPEAFHRTTGAGDLSLGGRVRILGAPWPVSLAGEVKIPSGYSGRANPSLGNGQVDTTVRGLVGGSAGWIYSTADAGWKHSGGSYQDQVLYSLEIGGRLFRDYRWRGVARGSRSLGRAAEGSSGPIFDPALANPQTLVLDAALGEEILPGLDLEAGIPRGQSGQNPLAGNTAEVGLSWPLAAGRGRCGPSA